MEFLNLDKLLTEDDVNLAENETGLVFPQSLRFLFINYNGGEPDPYCYYSEVVNIVVNETLPLISSSERDTALEVYQDLVIEKEMVPKRFFPFAIDPGGDYLFVDCDEKSAPVYIFRSDTAFSAEGMPEKICESLDEFWSVLRAEGDDS